jgi:peptidoglycan/LPS O-acetylase OafA/YrhL
LAWAVASRPIEKLTALFIALCIYQIHFAADSTPWRNLPVLLSPFVLGMLVAILVARLPKIKSEWLLLGLPVAIAVRMYYVHHQYLVISSSSWNMLLEPRGLICAIALSATLLGVATSKSLSKTIFSWEPLRVIGICGYGIFIFHNTAFTLLGHFLPPLGVIFLGIPLAIIAGMLSYLYIELPFQNYSHSGSFRRVGRLSTPQPLFLTPAPQSTEE